MLQPSDRLEVKVIRGLVEQKVIGLAIKSASQEDTHLLLTAKLLHEFVMKVFLDAESAEEHGSVTLGVPALHLGELILQLRHTVPVLIAEVGLGIESVLLLHDRPEYAMPHQDGVHDGVFVEGVVILAQHGEAFAWAEGDGATGWVEGAADCAQEGGLPCTIGTDDAVTVARGELEVHVLEKNALAKLDG